MSVSSWPLDWADAAGMSLTGTVDFYDVQWTGYRGCYGTIVKKGEPVSFQVTINILHYLQPRFFSLYRNSFNVENMLQEKQFLGSWRSDKASVIEMSLPSY